MPTWFDVAVRHSGSAVKEEEEEEEEEEEVEEEEVDIEMEWIEEREKKET